MRWHATRRGFKSIRRNRGGRIDCQRGQRSVPLTIRSESVAGAGLDGSSGWVETAGSVQSTVVALVALVAGATTGETTADGVAAGAGTSSIAERLSIAASRKLPQIISPPTTTPRSTMLPR